MIVPQSHLKMLNLLPSNKAAAEVLRRMGVVPSSQDLHLMQLAREKLDQENLDYLSDPYQDWGDLYRHLTEPVAKRLSEEMGESPDWMEDLSAAELMASIMDPIATILPFNPLTLQ